MYIVVSDCCKGLKLMDPYICNFGWDYWASGSGPVINYRLARIN